MTVMRSENPQRSALRFCKVYGLIRQIAGEEPRLGNVRGDGQRQVSGAAAHVDDTQISGRVIGQALDQPERCTAQKLGFFPGYEHAGSQFQVNAHETMQRRSRPVLNTCLVHHNSNSNLQPSKPSAINSVVK